MKTNDLGERCLGSCLLKGKSCRWCTEEMNASSKRKAESDARAAVIAEAVANRSPVPAVDWSGYTINGRPAMEFVKGSR